MDNRTLDKRKARDKEADDENSDTSTKNPTKRPRVDYSASPKEKSPSPASAQKSPMGKSSSVADSCTAATPAPSLDHETSDNGIPSANYAVISKPKFDLPNPLTSQELEQKIGKSDGADDGHDSDNESIKFLSDILESEEKKRKKQGKGKGSSGTDKDQNGALPSNSKRSGAGKSTSGSNKHQPMLSSSPLSDLSSGFLTGNNELEVSILIRDPTTRQVIAEETGILSDFSRVDSFLRQHNRKLSTASSQSSSGYLGDISSLESVGSGSSKSRNSSRWTISSLGSTIPRQSIVSIATDISDSPEEIQMKRPGKPAPVSKARKNSNGPILTSTKIEDDFSGSGDYLEKMNVSTNKMSNGGDDHLSLPSKSQPPAKKMRNTPSKGISQDEGFGGTPSQASTPGSARRITKKNVVTPGPSTPMASDSGVERSAGKKPTARRRGGSANNFPITTVLTPPVLNTPPPARSVAKIEGTSAKPISKFEQELNNEPVNEKDLEKSETLCSSIMLEELVFARWRDRNYYSGMVKRKGLNDTWLIDFDDGMEDVASETHIIPIRILGVGVKGVYSPDDRYEARQAEVIGQKFLKDPDDPTRSIVKYAIRIANEPVPIWCSRRQLSLNETEAKKLRPDFPLVAIGTKAGAGDVSLDNIVAGPRRRTRGEAESTPLAAAGFDSSTSAGDHQMTPRARGGGRKTPSEAKKKRPAPPATITNTPITTTPSTKGAGTPSPVKEKEALAKESPNKNQRVTTIEIGKKRSNKALLQGMQFFLTASGGGDPGTVGTPIVPADPYDKDELRECIENAGGEILDSVGDEGKDNVFLISDSYARTVKYIYCLAAGIPCVSHAWVKNCLSGHEILDWKVFTLPAGWSLEHQDLIPHHMNKPLKGCKIFVTSESDQLFNYWKPVLTAAEAILLKAPRKKGMLVPAGAEVVVTDNHSENTQYILDEANTHSIAVVKPEWLVQTIITGEKAHIYGHDKYRIFFNETEESEETLESGTGTEDGDAAYANNFLADMQNPD